MGFNPTEQQSFEIFQDSNKMATEYAQNATTFAFYLNGAAATAILAAGKTEFYPAALWMGLGAACAVSCIGVSYVYMLILAETWRQNETEKNGVKGFFYQFWNSDIFISTRTTEKMRFLPAGLWGFSMIFFCIWIGVAWTHI